MHSQQHFQHICASSSRLGWSAVAMSATAANRPRSRDTDGIARVLLPFFPSPDLFRRGSNLESRRWARRPCRRTRPC
eukprot:6632269-Alexandrium_andersonii.AAC.1